MNADKLSAAEADEYVRQAGSIAERLGVVNAPLSVLQLTDIMESYRPELSGSGTARRASSLLLVKPPFAGLARAGYQILAAGAVATLPAWARLELKLPTLPVTERVLIRPLARSAMGALRWALEPPPADLSEPS